VDRLETEARRLAGAGGKQEPFAAYRADAFATLFGQPAKGGKAEVVVVVSHEVAQRGWTSVEPGEVCQIPGVGPIDPHIVRDPAQEAFITGVVCDGKDLRQMRRWTRHIPTEIKLALNLGSPPDFDGRRCVDCTNRLRLEHDHDHPYVDGGPTSLRNLPDRCHPCHVAKTKADETRRRKRQRKRPATTGATSPGRAPPDTS
jgi:hypothetical protein